jgi:hypothetical protein
MTSATVTSLTALLQSGEPAPLPVTSPIGGPFWSYVVPAALLALAFVGTLLLYRHFARREGGA